MTSPKLQSLSLACTMGLLCAAMLAKADVLTTTVTQGGGQNWNAAIWRTNGLGLTVSPMAGNTYEAVENGVPFGNNTANTRLRNPASAGIQTFPGDSLTLRSNSEIRMKQSGAILNFPGVSGKAGLILAGGVLNAGDDATFEVRGKIEVSSQSYIAPGDQGGGAVKTGRAIRITGDLSGTGTMVVFQAATNLAQEIAGTANTFSGQWIVKAGRLLGSTQNSLGTNSITIDPGYVLPLDPSIQDVPGPAVLEAGYDLNSAGRLTLLNGGMVRLHQNCYFTSVSIEGALLSAGKHSYAELLANYPANFEAGGSGSITVQPYIPINPPAILAQPVPTMVYSGGTARFTVNASGVAPLAYRWRKGGANLSDTATLSGSTNATLTIQNVGDTDAGTYDVVISNGGGTITSSGATLGVAPLTGGAYETAILAAKPNSLYRLNENADPANRPPAFDFVGGYTGNYELGALNNVPGPALSGFPAGNTAAKFANGTPASRITVSPWNLNTNTVTLLAWIYPTGQQGPNAGIIFCRGGGTTAGLNFTGTQDMNGSYTLGYTWNNEWETWSWNSGLVPPPDAWSLVALVITPTDATIHLLSPGGASFASHPWKHVPQAFRGTTLIGGDSNDNNTGTRSFNGSIDDVAVFNRSLTRTEILSLYTAGSGVTTFPVFVAVQPVSLSLYAGQTATFTVAGGGPEPLSYQWQSGSGGTYANLSDNSRVTGSTSSTLTIRNITAADAKEYVVKISAGAGSATSTPVTLSVNATAPAERITMSVQQAGGTDWDNGSDWSDGLAATESAAQKPGSTYELLGGSRLRTPLNPSYAVFPGSTLLVQGNGVWTNNPGSAYTDISEIRFKQPNPGTVFFNKLVMNGGQLDTGNDGVVGIDGQVEIRTNAPIYNDGSGDRGMRIDALLTGNGTIEYRGYNASSYNPTYINNLNIAGNSNTFSGKWNVVTGTLLGTGSNSLGTNDIFVGAAGALETTYDINNASGILSLNGQMFLHQNDTFKSVIINGTPLAPGTYTFAQLSSTFTNNFPATWKPQTGATGFSSGSGSITVLAAVAPTITTQPASQTLYVGENAQLSVAVIGATPLSYQWRVGSTVLTDNARITGSTTANLSIANVALTDAGDYSVVINNPGGTATSTVAKVIVQPTSAAEHITMAVQQPGGSGWETGADWSDGMPASRSAAAKPGSTYEVLPGARVRSPDNAATATFPGELLTITGDGVWANNPAAGSTLGEMRFKQNGNGSVTFKKLVLNGGQLDTGNDGLVTLQGQIDVITNSSFNNNSSNDRGFLVNAWLTGSGNLEYHAYQSAYSAGFVNGLVIAGTSNTFSGKWYAAVGNLIGAAPNSLGTNDITVAFDAALETTYDVKNYTGTLTLDGQMFLHQNDTFRKVVIAGVELAEGTYTFAQLVAAYPNNFPATWTPHAGADSFRTASGSLTVWGNKPPPITAVTLTFQVTGTSLKLSWPQGALLEADTLAGPWNQVATTSPFTAVMTASQKFYKVKNP